METTVQELATTDPAEPENLALVALTPAEMPDQQAKLAAWCVKKLDAVQRELGTFRQLEEEAKAGGFRHASYSALVRKTEKRIVYYQKLQQAIAEGYLIVPNMPIDVFAVRVDTSRSPGYRETDYRRDRFATPPQRLPAGEGAYVDDHLVKRSGVREIVKDGKPEKKTFYFADEYDTDIDFPLRGVHPRVLEATSRAMALKLFDQLGVVQNQAIGRDPIVVGQLLDPRRNGRVTTFFVAWWLNTEDL
jgi:hypothetical protein